MLIRIRGIAIDDKLVQARTTIARASILSTLIAGDFHPRFALKDPAENEKIC